MRYNCVTIEREYASGGREVAARLAEALGWPYYGSEVLALAAQELGREVENLAGQDEAPPTLRTYVRMAVASAYGLENALRGEEVQDAEARVIRGLGNKGGCVIIGRRAGAILRGRRDVLRVFIHAARDARRQRAVKVYGVPEERAESTLKKYDKARAAYYHYYAGRGWDDAGEYHMMLDSGLLGLDGCVKAIRALLT
ncbi:cytidylate kinase [uncultured Clostridium sp.]|nr:cytidylate kinase [uncultured Clostridium sp.]